MTQFKELIERVISPGFCVGCGVCVSLCGKNSIKMVCNSHGQYEPTFIDESTCTSCGLCKSVCPFLNGNKDEAYISETKFSRIDKIEQTEETGYHLNSYVGYADEKTRLNGASGGALTLVIKHLLESKIIDKVITVKSTNDPQNLYQFTIVESVDDLYKCSKSAYYPVEMSEVLSMVLKSNERFAVVGLPCFVKAVELAKMKNSRLRNNIRYTFGLVCGQTKSKKYTEYLIWRMGIKLQDVLSVCYRRKVPDYPSSIYAFEAITKNGKIHRKMWNDEVSRVWVNDYFKQKSCYFCDDIFAECADVAFMDAWLPEYTKDYKGCNLIISRDPYISEIINSYSDFDEISIDRVIESQSGVVNNKRSFRNYINSQELNEYPRKRNFNITPVTEFADFEKKMNNSKITRDSNTTKVFSQVLAKTKKSIISKIKAHIKKMVKSVKNG